jgi:hypothetical protein
MLWAQKQTRLYYRTDLPPEDDTLRCFFEQQHTELKRIHKVLFGRDTIRMHYEGGLAVEAKSPGLHQDGVQASPITRPAYISRLGHPLTEWLSYDALKSEDPDVRKLLSTAAQEVGGELARDKLRELGYCKSHGSPGAVLLYLIGGVNAIWHCSGKMPEAPDGRIIPTATAFSRLYT